jgi:1,4-alpha-glucan branching enzyme
MHEFTRALNHFYLENPCLHREDTGFVGYRWLSVDDADNSVIAFVRRDGHSRLVCIFNFTPVTFERYRVVMDEATNASVTLRCAFSTHNREQTEIKVHKIRGGERYAEFPLYPFEAAFYKF